MGFWGNLAKIGGMVAAPFTGPFGPLITQGIGAAAGIYAGKQATSSAMERSPEERAAMSGAQGIAGQAAGMAGSLVQQSRPYIEQPANYYSSLLSGNRAAMSLATAPAAAQITGQYRGAQRGLEHAGVRGAARDFHAGELNRQRASQLAGLTAGVQPYAAQQLAGLGTNLLQSAAPYLSTAGSIYGNLLGYGQANRVYARGEGEKTGKAIGGLVADLGKLKFGGSGKPSAAGGAPPLPPVSAGVPAALPGRMPLPTLPTFPTAMAGGGGPIQGPPGVHQPWWGSY